MNATPNHRTQLAEQLCKILEDTAYMLVEDPEAPLPPPCEVIEAALPFSGREPGTCWLVVPEADAHRLALEMLGTSSSTSTAPNAAESAVGELLNILTAWVLDSWWGADEPHDIEVPVTLHKSLTETKFWELSDAERVVVTTDCGATFMSCITGQLGTAPTSSASGPG